MFDVVECFLIIVNYSQLLKSRNPKFIILNAFHTGLMYSKKFCPMLHQKKKKKKH